MLSIASTAAPIFSSNWEHHRPSVSSPLSSSPLRAQDDNNCSMRQTQSSPIQPPKFKYASRPSRPNPVMRRREDVQEQRRSNFLRGVREKAEDKAWKRRDIEGQFLKTSWIADMDRLSRDAPEISEADIEEASNFEPDSMQADDVDDMMVDEYADAELEAILASCQQPAGSPALRPISPTLSDDEYDDIFEELLSAKDIHQAMQVQQRNNADQMDME